MTSSDINVVDSHSHMQIPIHLQTPTLRYSWSNSLKCISISSTTQSTKQEPFHVSRANDEVPKDQHTIPFQKACKQSPAPTMQQNGAKDNDSFLFVAAEAQKPSHTMLCTQLSRQLMQKRPMQKNSAAEWGVLPSSHYNTPPGSATSPLPPLPTPYPPPEALPFTPTVCPSAGVACFLSMNMGFLPSLSSCLNRISGLSFKPKHRS